MKSSANSVKSHKKMIEKNVQDKSKRMGIDKKIGEKLQNEKQENIRIPVFSCLNRKKSISVVNH